MIWLWPAAGKTDMTGDVIDPHQENDSSFCAYFFLMGHMNRENEQ